MEQELVASGIGGQGIQIAVTILAKAAASEGKHVMTFSMFGGAIRGGRSECTAVIGDEPIDAPPIVPETQYALALHDRYFESVASRVRKNGLVIVNSDLVNVKLPVEVISLPLTTMAEELGSVSLVSMCALGAVCSATKLASVETVIETMKAEIPPHRRDRVASNERAINAGAIAV
ncbi:MAG: 2-oxoacid:acceptor oxidoreductase family protein [Actinomycetota bacterium]